MVDSFKSPELESAVIGGLINGASSVLDIINHPLVFTDYSCRVVYTAAMDLHKKGADINMGSVLDWLGRNKAGSVVRTLRNFMDNEDRLSRSYRANSSLLVGDISEGDEAIHLVKDCFTWLAKLIPVSAEIAEQNAGTLIELYQQRRLAESVLRITSKSDLSISDMISRIDSACVEVSSYDTRGTNFNSADIIEEYITTADEEDPFGLETCFPALTEIGVTLRPGNTYIVAAEPGVGKTITGVQIAHELAMQGKSILYFTFEMQPKEMSLRQFSYHSGMDEMEIHRAKQNPATRAELYSAWEQMKHCKFRLPDVKSMKLDNLVSTTKRLAAAGELDVLFVDYIQCVKSDGCTTDYEHVTRASEAVKELSLMCGIPVVCMSQLSRDKDRKKREPVLADLRGSGQLEQDATAVIFINKNYEKEDYPTGMMPVVFTVAKNRKGPCGAFAAYRVNKQCRFTTDWKEL